MARRAVPLWGWRGEGVGATLVVALGEEGGCLVGWLCFSPVASRVSPRRASYFLLLRQKKVTKEKASHVRAAYAVPCATRSVRDTCKLASLKQCKCLDPNAAPLLSTS